MKKTDDKSRNLYYLKTVLFYAFATVLVLYIVISLFFPKKSIDVFGFKPYVVITESMEPVIDVNDLIFVKKAKIDELEIDDIITFEVDINFDGEKEVVTHYVYSITEIEGGDLIFRTHPYFENEADYIQDFWVLQEEDILGEYMFKIPKLGLVIDFLKSPFGIAAMVVNVGVIVGVVYLIKSGKDETIKNN